MSSLQSTATAETCNCTGLRNPTVVLRYTSRQSVLKWPKKSRGSRTDSLEGPDRIVILSGSRGNAILAHEPPAPGGWRAFGELNRRTSLPMLSNTSGK
jgi:hypothetical protein